MEKKRRVSWHSILSSCAVILTLEAPRLAAQVRHNESLLPKSFEKGLHYIITKMSINGVLKVKGMP